MTAFKSLTRVHNWILNEKRQKLAGIDELIEKMKIDLQHLEDEIESENKAATASIEGTIAFPAFVAASLERRRRQRQTIAELEKSAEAAREEVHAAFQDVKKYQHAEELEARQKRDERSRREQIELDELGTVIFRRGQAAGED